MSAGDWKSMYQAAVSGNLPLLQHHLREGVDPNYQHPEILRTVLVASLVEGHAEVVSGLDDLSPLQAARRHGRHEFVALLRGLGAKETRKPFWWRWLPI